MAHFAKLGTNSKVISVHVLDNKDMLNADNQEDESVGQQRLEEIHGWPGPLWIQTSYNTVQNTHKSGDNAKAFRGNYAGIGYTWDDVNNIFWPPQPHASWTKNTSTASWTAPITYPSVTTYTADDSSTQNWEIYWDEAAYQANNSKGWEATKFGASAVFEWNGSAWVAQ